MLLPFPLDGSGSFHSPREEAEEWYDELHFPQELRDILYVTSSVSRAQLPRLSLSRTPARGSRSKWRGILGKRFVLTVYHRRLLLSSCAAQLLPRGISRIELIMFAGTGAPPDVLHKVRPEQIPPPRAPCVSSRVAALGHRARVSGSGSVVHGVPGPCVSCPFLAQVARKVLQTVRQHPHRVHNPGGMLYNGAKAMLEAAAKRCVAPRAPSSPILVPPFLSSAAPPLQLSAARPHDPAPPPRAGAPPKRAPRPPAPPRRPRRASSPPPRSRGTAAGRRRPRGCGTSSRRRCSR